MTDSTERPPIVAFIEARLAEDEDLAAGAERGPRRPDWSEDYGQEFIVVVGVRDGVPDCVVRSTDESRHIARHDPARVLRQCAGIREMLDYLVGLATDYQDDWDSVIENGGRWLPTSGHYNVYPALERLAATWSTHPDFRPEWAPTEEDPS